MTLLELTVTWKGAAEDTRKRIPNMKIWQTYVWQEDTPSGSFLQKTDAEAFLHSLYEQHWEPKEWREGQGNTLSEVSLRPLNMRPVGSDIVKMTRLQSHHRQEVLGQHCCPANTRLYQDKGRSTCWLAGTLLMMFMICNYSHYITQHGSFLY